MKTFAYAALFEPGDKRGIVVTFPDVPEAITQGKNEVDARSQAEEALGLALLSYIERGLDLPKPVARGRDLVTIHVAFRRRHQAGGAAGLCRRRNLQDRTRPSNRSRREGDPPHTGSGSPGQAWPDGRGAARARQAPGRRRRGRRLIVNVDFFAFKVGRKVKHEGLGMTARFAQPDGFEFLLGQGLAEP
jgi:predicted RNase H-like HicB family nuclease